VLIATKGPRQFRSQIAYVPATPNRLVVRLPPRPNGKCKADVVPVLRPRLAEKKPRRSRAYLITKAILFLTCDWVVPILVPRAFPGCANKVVAVHIGVHVKPVHASRRAGILLALQRVRGKPSGSNPYTPGAGLPTQSPPSWYEASPPLESGAGLRTQS